MAYELLDSRGELHHVTRESDPELFSTLPWSYGTLGFVVSLTVRLVKWWYTSYKSYKVTKLQS